MLRKLSVALALAVCVGSSTAQAAGGAYAIKELKELLAPVAKKEIVLLRTAISVRVKAISVRVQVAADNGAKFVKDLGTIGAGIATGPVALCYSQNWCYQTGAFISSYFGFRDPNDSRRPHDHE
jgi:hypothetical protein